MKLLILLLLTGWQPDIFEYSMGVFWGTLIGLSLGLKWAKWYILRNGIPKHWTENKK